MDRTFAAVVIDWDRLAAARRSGRCEPLQQRVEQLSATGVHVAVISSGSLDDLDSRLHARPRGPGGLLLGLNRGTELYEVGRTGPRLLLRRGGPSPAEASALERAGQAVVEALAAKGMRSHLKTGVDGRAVVSIAARDRALMHTTPTRSAPETIARGCGGEHSDVAEKATALARRAGLSRPRVTCREARIEIGTVDKADSVLDVLDVLAAEGIGPGLVLLVGCDFGPQIQPPSGESVLVPELARATVVSVGREVNGSGPDVRHIGGGQSNLLRLLDEQLNRSQTMRVPSVDTDPGWVLRETGTDVQSHRVNETLFTLGASGIATRGSVEEPSDLSVPLVLAAGVYHGSGSQQRPLPGPRWTDLLIEPEPVEDVRVLDMRTGVLYREETALDGPPLRSLRFVSLTLPGLMAMRAEAGTGRIRSGPPLQSPRDVSAIEGSPNGRRWMRVGAEGAGGIGAVAVQRTGEDVARSTVERFAGYVADPYHSPALTEAHSLLDLAEQRGFDRVLAEHRAAWAARWENVDIRIPDDPAAERAVRFALFQLWCNSSLYDHLDELAVGARGLSGHGYAGHVFWDADIFVLPAMLSIDPEAAAAMVGYRLRRLDAAIRHAAATGHEGARFPWESAATGEDVTPAFGQLGAERVPILTGILEEHVTADVAWAAVHCARWTGRQITESSPEWPLLRETARYWASRARRDPRDGSAHIDNVIGPDEYHESVNDNAFTNAMARWNLRVAADVADSVRMMEAESRRWRELANALVDGYDPATRRYEQFAGYYALEPLLVHDYAPPPVAADVLFGRERISASQTIKQADVLMLHHLIPDDVAPGSLGPNLDFYGPRTAHGSSLSPAISASLLARAGRSDNALSMLRLAMGLDLEDLNGTTASGLHVATLGGIWQAILFGFLGVRVADHTLSLDPDLPTAWRTMEVRFRCLGRCVRVHVHPSRVEVTTDGPLRVQLSGREVREITGHVSFDR